MVARFFIRDDSSDNRIFRERVWSAAIVMSALLLFFAIRLAQIQVVHYDHYTTLSHENRVKILPIPPNRGLIYSSDGVLLAENRPTFSLEVVPEQIRDFTQTVEALRGLLTITDEDIERFRRATKKKRRFENVPLRLNLTEEEIARFSVDRHRFPGIDIVVHQARNYPLGALMGHVVGYVGRIDEEELKSLDVSSYSGTSHIGKNGVEKSYETVLHGQVGLQQVEVNAQGRVLRVLEKTAPGPGKDLHLTINASLQAAATQALGDQLGAVVAIEPSTGGVLALVSNPSYDPNPFVNGIESKLYAALRDSPARPLFNRALQGKYPPGSTVKPFFALAGLEYGIRTTDDSAWCPGWYSLPGQDHKYRCWKKTGHGHVNLKQAIAQSCDVYFYRLAQDLGIDRMHDYMTGFGFGRVTGVDLPGEAAGLMPSRDWKRKYRRAVWYPGESLIAGIGQGYFLATPMQLAVATATLANRGIPKRPTLVARLEDPATHAGEPGSQEPQPQPFKIRPNYLASVIGAMEEVVHGVTGTAKASAMGAAYRYAGKTGTSQVFGIKQNQTIDSKKLSKKLWDHALFVAFAPAADPKIALAIIVEHGGSGSGAAAPIARKIFDHYLVRQETGSGTNGQAAH